MYHIEESNPSNGGSLTDFALEWTRCIRPHVHNRGGRGRPAGLRHGARREQIFAGALHERLWSHLGTDNSIHHFARRLYVGGPRTVLNKLWVWVGNLPYHGFTAVPLKHEMLISIRFQLDCNNIRLQLP